MMELKRISKTLFGYLKRPELYPEMGRKIVKNTLLRGAATKGKERANEWAAQLAVTQDEGIKTLFRTDMSDITKLFPQVFEEARNRVSSCPVKMGGAGALNLIYYACEYTHSKYVLETGVAYGWSSLAALLSLEKRAGHLYSSDMPYLAQDGDGYVGVAVPSNLRKNWHLYRYADRESLPKIFNEQAVFDVIHYDSDKSYHGMFWAYNVLYNRLRKGGVFISDDINDNAAFYDFCNKKGIASTVVELEGKYIGIFIK